MAPIKKPHEDTHKRMKITVEMKRKIIAKREQGETMADIARTFNRSTSTICTILKHKDKIKESDASKGVTRISAQRLPILDDVERLLLVWINEKQMHGDTINENVICEKAKMIYGDLVKKTPASATTAAAEQAFKGSRGWFEKFKRRTGIDSFVQHTQAAENFISEFKRLVDSEGYMPQQVFNCDETSLFWKKMPKGISTSSTSHQSIQDRLTLLFCANASGDLKIKPLLVYPTETPRAFKTCKVQKSTLNVMWRSNNKACVTRDLFTDWINEVFGPSVRNYLLAMNLPLQALLVMDTAPAHPPSLQDDLLDEFKFIKIQYLPANVTAILQPMNQQVIVSFKKLYTKALLERCFEVTESTNLSLREFWNNHFHIVACLKIIDKAWNSVTAASLTSAWTKLWPECVVKCEFEEFEPVFVDEIVSLANILGLEVDNNDIDELLQEHKQELSTDELIELHCVSQEEDMEQSLAEAEVATQPQSSDAIRDMLKTWESVASYIETHHPNKAVAMRATNLFNDTALSHFHQILKRRQKQKLPE